MAVAESPVSRDPGCQTPASALLVYEEARRREPGNPEHHNNAGVALKALGRLDEAVEAYKRAIALAPDHAIAHHNLGNALKALGRLDEAAARFRQAVVLRPDNAGALNSLGATLQELDQLAEAETCLRQAIKLRPGYAEAYNHLGMVLQSAERLEEGCAAYRQALSLRPDYAEALSNLGYAYRRLGLLEAAEAQYGLALVHRPDFDVAAMNRGLVALARSAFRTGWADYLRRPVARTLAPLPTAPLPRNLGGAAILVLREQGLGDEIFFMRFVPALKARGARVVVQVSDRLRSIFARCVPADGFVDREAPSDISRRCYAGDLPFLLGLTDESSFAPSIRVAPREADVARQRERLHALGKPPFIALTWRGGVKGAGKLFKTANFGALSGALANRPGTLVALQRGIVEGEAERLATALERPVHDLGVAHDDLEDVLAALALFDDYVTVSNTYVHLRAALGLSAQVMVPHPPEFRWLVAGDTSPWFPRFAVIRQGIDGHWPCISAVSARDRRPPRKAKR